MLPMHYNCRCVILPVEPTISFDAERAIEEICIISPRSLPDVRRSFIDYLKQQPYAASDFVAICLAQIRAGHPLPWEVGYESSVLESIFK